MSSKFFTWTKGDRSRNAPESLYSGGMVPIPVECIHIKGFDYSRTSKKDHRRPLPLRLEPSPEVSSPYDEQTDDQTTLQDAAVKSATSLIAVVNDMLRSPLASARLPPPPSMLAPHHGRPRSRTAPSTPLVEMPAHTPVELPGSIPDRPRPSYNHSYDSKLRQQTRPNSQANRPSHPWLHPPSDDKSDMPMGDHRKSTPPHYTQPSTPQPQQRRESRTGSTSRLSAPVSHRRRIWSDPTQSRGSQCPMSAAPQRETTVDRHRPQPFPTPRPESDTGRPSYENSVLSEGHDSALEYASSLQASHEAHMAALTEAHQHEIASLHLYIAQLEPRHGLSRTSEVHAHPSARQLATCQSSGTYKSANARRSTPTGHGEPSRRSNLTGHTHTTTDPHCTSLAGCGEIWLECNNLRNTLETTNTRLSQSEETIQRMQCVEKSLKITIEDLQSRLLAANNERLDYQEGLHDACCRVRGLAKREANLVHELEELQKCSSISSVAGPPYERTTNFSERDLQHRSPESNPSTTNPAVQPPSPPLSPSHSPSPSALGISIPQTPRTVASATAEALLVATDSPGTYTYPRTPPTGVHKELPLPPLDASPTPVRLRRGETVKSVGNSIIELYAAREGDDWDRGWCEDELEEEKGGRGWVEWV